MCSSRNTAEKKGRPKPPIFNIVQTVMRSSSSSFRGRQVPNQATFEVACFVLVDDVFLGQTVNHGRHLGQLLLQLFDVRGSTVLAEGIPHGLVVVTVAEALGLVGTDPLQG